MDMQLFEIIGLRYVLLLGAWWGVALIATLLVMAIQQAWSRRARSGASHPGPAATGGLLDI